MEIEMGLGYRRHKHGMILKDEIDSSAICGACDDPLSGSAYTCSHCSFMVHQSCFDMLDEFHHAFHWHPLKLVDRTEDMEFKCNSCFETRCGSSFCCRECNFNLDINCALLTPTTNVNDQDILITTRWVRYLGVEIDEIKVKDFAHQHLLMLNDKMDSGEKCKVCDDPFSGPNYSCSQCSFRLHKSCAELLRDFQYAYHPHPLTLVDRARKLKCDGCLETHQGCSFYCKECDFELGVKCALLKPTVNFYGQGILTTTRWARYFGEEIDEMKFKHFDHEHPLMFNDKMDPSSKCRACGDYLSGQGYSCSKCSFNLHKSCAELSLELQNPYHLHPLTLVAKSDNEFRCHCCHKYHSDCEFFFCCKKCDFNLDVKCAMVKPIKNKGQDILKHFTHLHPLVVIDNKGHLENDIHCWMCGERICGAALYGCEPCNFYLDQPCAELQLPQTLQHFYHPCLLTLRQISYSIKCECGGSTYDALPYYQCKPCNFEIHCICAIFPEMMECRGHQQFHHFSHVHPLKLIDDDDDDDGICCQACTNHLSGQAYVCYIKECRFSLHQSCFLWPQRIHYPFHPHHNLTLYTDLRRSKRVCKVCHSSTRGFYYSCDYCEFLIDPKCRVAISCIKYQGHHHNLLFVERVGPFRSLSSRCHACDGRFKKSSPVFQCLECSNFFLHLECGPLPCSIKDEYHGIHPLTLTDSPVLVEGEEKEDREDGFYCDICEKRRDPRLPVYYCSEGCPYIAELKCVASEVMLSLRGDSGEVELRSPVRHIAGKVIRRYEGVAERIELEEAGEDCKRKIHMKTGEVVVKPTMNNEMSPSFTEEDAFEIKSSVLAVREYCYLNKTRMIQQWFPVEGYTEIVELLKHEEINVKAPWNKGNPYVSPGNDLVITSSFAPIFTDVCANYGDITAETTLCGFAAKTYCIAKLCWTINSMYSKRVVDTSKDLLYIWWIYLKSLQFVGFNVQFALDRLQRIVHAYYGLKMKEVKNKNCDEIDEKIRYVSENIEKLEAQLASEKAELEELKQRRKTRESTKPSYSSIEAERLKEASVLKWMIAGDGLL